MAVWQFKIELVPREWAISSSSAIDKLYVDGSYDSEVAWRSISYSSIDLNVFDNLYVRYKSWHEDLVCWGDVEGTDFQLWRTGSFVESISIRLSALSDVNSDILNVVSISKSFGCYLFFPELRAIVEPNEFLLRSNFIKSKAMDFVKDPVGFLKKLT